MFEKKGSYSQVDLGEFSDDDSTGGMGGFGARSRDSGDGDYADNSLRRQQEQLQRQDEGLEMLGQSAERLGKMSLAISEELGQQNKMLDEMDQDLDQAGENLDYVTRKTKEFIDKSGGTKNFLVILCLSAVVVVLLFLIIYG